jgi:uncharacterized membrane protein YedE/YeeE
LLALNGRIAGISGIANGLIRPSRGDWAWRAAFVVGLIVGAAAYRFGGGPLQNLEFVPATLGLVIAGFLVGFGARLGSGCTSGHGVCGLARLSPRSFAAVIVFTVSAMITVYLVRHVWGVG